jgi:hypothetical protein
MQLNSQRSYGLMFGKSLIFSFVLGLTNVYSLNQTIVNNINSAENDISVKLSDIILKSHPLNNYTASEPPDLSINYVNISLSVPISSKSTWKGKMGNSFEGLSNTGYFPADSSGAIGINHYVHTVNVKLGIFDRAGNTLYNQNINSLFQDFGTGCTSATPSPACACQVNNNGDGVVVYDKLAQRFLVGQFSITNPTIYGYYYCIAVSQTSNPMGSWYRYAFPTDGFFDYGKLVHWNDVYALTGDVFPLVGGYFPQICVFDRQKMLSGLSATFLCKTMPLFQYGMSPAENEKSDLSIYKPIKLINLDTQFSSSSTIYITEVDYTLNPITIQTAVQIVQVNSYTLACSTLGKSCVSQPNTNVMLDGLSTYPMFRMIYRYNKESNIEYMAFNHNVEVSTTQLGVAWNIISRVLGTQQWNVFKSGFHNPDSIHSRWIASLAFDKHFNLGIGYSVSSSVTYPSIRISGRLFNDPDGQLMQEQTVIAGTNSQDVFDRWGDYSHMTVDPLDDCTFWYVNMYQKDYNVWSTKIVSFVFPSCLIPSFSSSTGSHSSSTGSHSSSTGSHSSSTGSHSSSTGSHSSSTGKFSSSTGSHSNSMRSHSSSMESHSSSTGSHSSSTGLHSSSNEAYSSSTASFSSSNEAYSSSTESHSSSNEAYSSSNAPHSSSNAPHSSSNEAYSSSNAPHSSSTAPFSSSTGVYISSSSNIYLQYPQYILYIILNIFILLMIK